MSSDKICVCRDVPQGAGWSMGARLCRPGLHDRRNANPRLHPLALHRFHPSHRKALPRELAEDAERRVGGRGKHRRLVYNLIYKQKFICETACCSRQGFDKNLSPHAAYGRKSYRI